MLSEEAIKLGLSKNIDLTDQITQLKQTLLINALIENYLKENPITDAKVNAEFDYYQKSVGTKGPYQYQYSQIILLKESDAIAVINRLDNGEDFALIARQVSVDNATKNQGGQVGWINP